MAVEVLAKGAGGANGGPERLSCKVDVGSTISRNKLACRSFLMYSRCASVPQMPK